MINKKIFINESKLSKLINLGSNNIVNLKDDYFEYCNGYFLVNCTYNLDLVIQKLFKTGAIKNYKNWEPERSFNLDDVINCEKETGAIKTEYLKMHKFNNGDLTYVFKIGNRYLSYNKDYCDIFQNVEYRANDNGSEFPYLRIYGDGKLIGVILPIREEHNLLTEIMAGRSHE